MPIRNLLRRVQALERTSPGNTAKNAIARLRQIVARAEQIAAETNQAFNATLGRAIEELGTPLTIEDVDDILRF